MNKYLTKELTKIGSKVVYARDYTTGIFILGNIENVDEERCFIDWGKNSITRKSSEYFSTPFSTSRVGLVQ